MQERLTELDHVRVDVNDGPTSTRIHARRTSTTGALLLLLLLHGWPESFLRLKRTIPLLADDGELVIPSIPGFGFSQHLTAPGAGPVWVADRIAELMPELMRELMRELRHPRFGVHGSAALRSNVRRLGRRGGFRAVWCRLGWLQLTSHGRPG